MSNAPVIAPASRGRTLGVTAWVLGLLALVELATGGVALVQRARNSAPLKIKVPPDGLAKDTAEPVRGDGSQLALSDPWGSAAGAASPTPGSSVKPLQMAQPTPVLPVANGKASPGGVTPVNTAAAASASPFPALPKPTPVPERQVVGPESRVDALVAEARALRERGDTSTAVTRLREALALSPKSALVVSELATTYEKMDLGDRALEQWRIIYDMGESAGIYYQAAAAKLKMAELAQQEAAAPQSTPGGGKLESGDGGFQPGSSLALVSLSTVVKPDTPDGYKRFTLKIPVKRRPNIKINVSDVIIQVFFFDQLGDDSIVRTNANVSSHWSTLPADWQAEDLEILEVDYTQAKPEPGKIEEGRHYYGYIVCVYYKKDLQDMAADPQELLKKNPPPLTLSQKAENP